MGCNLPALPRETAELSEGFQLVLSKEQKFYLSGKSVCPFNNCVV